MLIGTLYQKVINVDHNNLRILAKESFKKLSDRLIVVSILLVIVGLLSKLAVFPKVRNISELTGSVRIRGLGILSLIII